MKKELLNCVAMSNEFARNAEIKMSCNEWKLLLYMISRIKKHEIFFMYEQINIHEFMSITGISTRSIVRNAAEALGDKTFNIKDKEYKLFDFMSTDKKNIYYKFDESMREHLLGLDDNMTIFDFGYIYNINSKYAIRMYLFGHSFCFLTYYNRDADEMNKFICDGLPKSELERRVLLPALEEINNTTDIFLHMRYKNGRYYFATAEKNERQKDKYHVDTWKNEIEAQANYSSISKELFADLDFEEL